MLATKNYVTLGSGGVGRATGYQNYHKTYLGVARNTHNDVWDTLEAFPRLSSGFFAYFTDFAAARMEEKLPNSL